MAKRETQAPAEADTRPIIIGETASPRPDCEKLRHDVESLTEALELQRREFRRLSQITAQINRGQRLEDVLNFIYDEFADVIPYNRIGYASINYEQELIVSQWARSDNPQQIVEGYSRPFSETSLMDLARTGRPRIINNLADYSRTKAAGETAQMLVDEQMRSSLTCPLVVDGRPVGFLFFDSMRPDAYSNAHVDFFLQIAGVVSVAIERGRMFSQLAERNRTIEQQNRQLADENERNAREMELARKVQLALIPRVLPRSDRIKMSILYEPAELIGGDALNAISLRDGCLAVYLADAMGHGVSAALLMSVVTAAFRMAVTQDEAQGACSPSQVLRQVNEAIVGLFEMNYVTALCCLLDPNRGRMVYSVAGHPPGLIRRAGGHVEELGTRGGIPLGIEDDVVYHDVSVDLGPEDLLLLYTDGVIEAAGPDGAQFGMHRLKALLARSDLQTADHATQALHDQLMGHCKCHKLEDDVTVLAAKCIS
ncbi:MAG: SpoIIE family protein phosphatase [Planctomycetes bacterium]|nr:SpoIIE family protein phosphatase [Planctomycetota bacterium]